ncbi:hypothetical protein SAMN04515674_11533 [Pseudarcicella hirudinis]|uniref:Uncharacterized protein n=1 Tax=Pseudarcicella hirudinis TaxID=1079859 RepID=A0A1I5XKC7_9BACT|nr:hypothetical protein SAMN04515674_11533 [Pseudarcicella hirudinis]
MSGKAENGYLSYGQNNIKKVIKYPSGRKDVTLLFCQK